jgi:hypothetical protein
MKRSSITDVEVPLGYEGGSGDNILVPPYIHQGY